MFLLEFALIIAAPFWQSELLSVMAASRSSSRLPLRATGLNAFCLVLVRLAHDRRFVGAVVFFVLVLFVLVFRISSRHRVAHDHEGTPVDLGGKFLGDVWGHALAPRMCPWDFLPFFSDLDYNRVLHNRICCSPVFIREPTLE